MTAKITTALLLGAALSTAAFAQPAPAPESAVAAPATAGPALPAGASVLLRFNNQLTTRDQRVGDTFPLTVVSDVALDGRVVIPAGTRAVGQVTWRTGRGSFGKSGKMEVTMRYLDLGGRRIPLSGFLRQEGEGNTGATIGAVVAAGVIGGLIVHGRTARIPEGREITALTVDVIPLAVGADGAVAIADNCTPTAVATELGQRRDAQAETSRERRRRS